MSKYLNLFKTKAEADAAIYDKNNTPNVSYCEEDNSVNYYDNLFNGYEAVDLGIKADNGNRLLFAKYPIGGSEGYYSHFNWGSTKNSQNNDDIHTDNVMDIQHDTARNIMKGRWRMATLSELEQLCSLSILYYRKNDKTNARFRKDDNFIIIPCNGRYFDNHDLNGYRLFDKSDFQTVGSAYIWSSTCVDNNPVALCLIGYKNSSTSMNFEKKFNYFSRDYGFGVLGVIELTEEEYQKYVVNKQ